MTIYVVPQLISFSFPELALPHSQLQTPDRNDFSCRDIQHEVSGVTFGSPHIQIQSAENPHVIDPIVPVRGCLNLFKSDYLRYQVEGIYDALLAVCNNSEIDNSIRVDASGLLSCVEQFKFLCCIEILNCINPISKLWQTEDYDLPSAMEHLKNRKDFFKDLRSDTALNEMLCNAREFADEIDTPANFELTQPRHRVRKRNVNFDYEAREVSIEDPTLKYKAEFYFFTLEIKLSKNSNPGLI
ncbi:DUF4371 domain-containing protein [Trichonephila clavipes]|nr:DUF4371 domain-containing protein [Trichonephila clavipes]